MTNKSRRSNSISNNSRISNNKSYISYVRFYNSKKTTNRANLIKSST